MLPYYSFGFVISLFAMMSVVRHPRALQAVTLGFLAVALILFAGLRDEIDPDYWNYVFAFAVTPDITDWISGTFSYSLSFVWMEPGYLAFTAIVKLFVDDSMFLFLSVATLSIGIACYNYYKMSVFPLFSILLFFSHTFLYRDMIQIRAAVACAFGLFVIRYLAERNYLRASIFVVLAASFHMGALVYFVVFPMFLMTHTRRLFLTIVGIGFVLGVSGAGTYILSLSSFVGAVGAKISHYESSAYANSLSLFDLTNLKNLVLCAGVYIYWDRLSDRAPYFSALAMFLACGVAWRIGFSDFGIIAARVATFLSISEVIILPAFILVFRPKPVVGLLIILYAFAMMYQNLAIKGVLDAYETVI